jgi:hypothetical protein
MMKGELFTCLDQMDLIWCETYEVSWDRLPRGKLLRTTEFSSVYNDDSIPSLHHVEKVESTRSPVQCLDSLRKFVIF